MAQQILTIPASSFLVQPDRVEWALTGTNRPEIDSSLVPSGTRRWFAIAQFYASGRFVLRLADPQSEFSTGTGDDLSDAFESGGSLTIEAGGQTLRVPFASADTVEPYDFTPTNGADVTAFYNALNAMTGVAATITLSDGVVDINTIPAKQGEIARALITAGDSSWWYNFRRNADGSVVSQTEVDYGSVTGDLELAPDPTAGEGITDVALLLGTLRWFTAENRLLLRRQDPTPPVEQAFNSWVTSGRSVGGAPENRFRNIRFNITGGGGGTGAVLRAHTSGGAVISVEVLDGGSGYTSAPTVTAVSGRGSLAAFTAQVAGGAITSVTVNTGGDDYSNTLQDNDPGWIYSLYFRTAGDQTADIEIPLWSALDEATGTGEHFMNVDVPAAAQTAFNAVSTDDLINFVIAYRSDYTPPVTTKEVAGAMVSPGGSTSALVSKQAPGTKPIAATAPGSGGAADARVEKSTPGTKAVAGAMVNPGGVVSAGVEKAAASNTTVVAEAGPNLMVDGGAMVMLQGSATITNGVGATTYLWQRVSPTDLGDLDDPSILQPTFDAHDVAFVNTARYRLTVTNNGVSDSDEVTITINPVLSAPMFPTDTGPAQSWHVQEVVLLHIPSATGNPGPNYSVSGLPSGLQRGHLDISGRVTEAGSGDIVVTATNSQGSDTYTIPYTVRELPPKMTAATAPGPGGVASAGVTKSAAVMDRIVAGSAPGGGSAASAGVVKVFRDVRSLLPPGKTPLEVALEAATAPRVDPDVIRDLWDPWRIPAKLLPWLAWSLSVDYWDPEWTEAQKRQVVASSIEVHRRKGTVGAMRRVVEALGLEFAILEWWETTPEGTPGTAEIFLSRTEGGSAVTDSDLRLAERLLEDAKRATLHITVTAAFEADMTGHLLAYGTAIEHQDFTYDVNRTQHPEAADAQAYLYVHAAAYEHQTFTYPATY